MNIRLFLHQVSVGFGEKTRLPGLIWIKINSFDSKVSSIEHSMKAEYVNITRTIYDE